MTAEARVNNPIPAVTRVVLKNFKSIQGCSVDMGPLTLLVGPNGAGKSNFLDGLRLTTDAVKSSLENAFRERGGIEEVRRRSRGHPSNFGVRLELRIDFEHTAEYAYEVTARTGQTFEIRREECRVWNNGAIVAEFVNEHGIVRSTVGLSPVKVTNNSLALPIMSSIPPYNLVLEAIANIGFYSFNLDRVRELQNPDAGNLLRRDGSNLAAVIRQIQHDSPEKLERITEYLAAVVPGVRSIQTRPLGPKETIEIRQEVLGDTNPWKFYASSVSDGTLRALGVLVAVFQNPIGEVGIPLIAIEEPEVAIHPGAALRLMDALLEASRTRQLILTTHSPDLLDHPDIDVESVVAVQSSGGTSVLGPVEESTRRAVRSSLYTVGELLRLEQVKPEVFPGLGNIQPKLFEWQ